MHSTATETPNASAGPATSLPAGEATRAALLALFVASGCAALIYEIVWFQLLQLVIGSSAVSLAVLLGTFMGGMCLGSLWLPRLISPAHHPLRAYALLEIGTGLIGLGVLFGMPWVGHLYVAHAGHGFGGILLRSVACAICLLPPTLLMGATLPAISRWVQTTREGVSWMGFFYGGNIAGAVVGSLLAGFYLLRVHDMAVATYFAAALNFAIGIAGWLLARITPAAAAVAIRKELPPAIFPRSRAPGVYLVIALSGFCALGAEVVWTRILSLMLGGTVYTFSVILAVFLLGLGIGSGFGSLLARSTRPRLLLGCCQLFLTVAVAWSAYMLARSLPYWPIDPGLSTSPWYTFQLDLLRCMWGILPATCLWGASFPLALAAVARDGEDPGRLVGGVYAANTLGAIFGAVFFSLVLIAWGGSQNAQRVLVAVSALAALLALVPPLLVGRDEPPRHAVGRAFGSIALLSAIVLAALITRAIPKVPPGLVAHGRYLASTGDSREVLYVGEGMNASVAVTQSGGIRYFHVAGKVEASSDPQDMRLQRMLGHIPALLHPTGPRRVLVVGCGAGVTAGSFLTYPSVQRVEICEIEPLIPKVVATYFTKENYNVVNDPRTHVNFDDARHYVLTSDQTFDIITSDPINPWVKGAATLYTKEYFEMCKRHLAPGGLVTQWVPLYESTLDAVKSEIATFFEVFPNGTIWSNDASGRGYDIVLLGGDESAGPMRVNVDALQELLNRPDHRRVQQSLGDVEFHSIVDLLATYGGRAADLAPWLDGAQINRDRNLRLQYLAGFGMNAYSEGWIFDQMVRYRQFPNDLFAGSDVTKQILRTQMEQGKPGK